jgi:predicted helicase
MNDFTRVLDKYRKLSYSQKDKGSRFERLMQGYLQTDRCIPLNFKKVWLIDNWFRFLNLKQLPPTEIFFPTFAK